MKHTYWASWLGHYCWVGDAGDAWAKWTLLVMCVAAAAKPWLRMRRIVFFQTEGREVPVDV